MKKSFKIFTVIAAVATAASAIVLGSVVASNPENGFLRRAFAAPVSNGEIVFDGANSSTTGSGTGTASSVVNTTVANNHNIVCKITKNYSASAATKKLGAVQNGSEIRFYEADGETEFTFQDIEKISFYTDGTYYGFDMTFMQTNGSITTNSYGAKTNNPRNLTFSNDTSYLWIKCTSSQTNVLSKIVLTYNCSSKAQTGVSINTQPAKTIYTEKEYFDPTGLVLNQVFSDSTTIATQGFTYSPTRRLTMDDTYVTVTNNGFSVDIPITVNVNENLVVGTYKYSNYYLKLNSDGTGSNYNVVDDVSTDLTWSYDTTLDKIYLTAPAIADFNGSYFYQSTTAEVNVYYNGDGSVYRVRGLFRFGSSTSNSYMVKQ